MDAPALLSDYAALIEAALDRHFRDLTGVPEPLAGAMAYSACGGGKRFRGGLAIGACVAVGGRAEEALPVACALEMVHAFSLVHDDLPCMDDDDLRRGKPANHKVYGEALALLAGDGLLVAGLTVLAGGVDGCPPERTLAAMRTLLLALGPAGMIGGQVLDMQAERARLDLAALRSLHAAKTGALIRASVRIGAVMGGGNEKYLAALDSYASSLGLAFQIVDDLLDLSGNAATLGKTPGSDLKNGKSTYPSLLGPDGARETADREIRRALESLEPFGERGAFLAQMARYVGERDR